MKIEEKLDALEDGVEEIKLMQLELTKKNARLQLLIERMEQQLNQYESAMDLEKPAKVNNGELLSLYGIMSQPKQVISYEAMLYTPHVP